MQLTFLGTGPAWGLPELLCSCQICQTMRRKGEKRRRSSFLLKGEEKVLLDCGPDIKEQLEGTRVGPDIRAILISHEHNDHYMGLDDLFPLKRTKARDEFQPIEVFSSESTYIEINRRFGYLEEFGVIKHTIVEPNRWYELRDLSFMPFKTFHGDSAKGSMGFLIQFSTKSSQRRLIYTSDFMEIVGWDPGLKNPDYLIIQSFWLNEPVQNRPKHMSFQRALEYIRLFEPQRSVFLVHMGDGDSVPGDPQNRILKKYEAKDPLRPPKGNAPYPIPRCQQEWQEIVETILEDYRFPWRIYVAQDFQDISFI